MSFLQSQGSPVAINNNNISPIVVSLSYTKVSISWNNVSKTYKDTGRSKSPFAYNLQQNIGVDIEVPHLTSWNHDNSEKTHIELDVLLSKGTSNLREMLAGLEYLYFRDSNPHIRQAEELQD
jgi:hypothetical protein